MSIRLRAFLFIGLLLFAARVSAQMPDTVFLEQLTTVELQQQLSAGKTTIIVPIGGTEQNGPAMALGKHNVRVKALAERIARALGNAIVAPVIAYAPEGEIDPLTSHMRFPGTITVPGDIFEKTLESAGRGFKAHGFLDIVFLGDHGGYKAHLAHVADRLNRQWVATPVRAHAIPEYYRVTLDYFVPELKKRGYTEAEIGTHAGLADTSLMLALDPSLVRTERLRTTPPPGATDGVYGNPARSSAELGDLAVKAIVAQTVVAIKTATVRR